MKTFTIVIWSRDGDELEYKSLSVKANNQMISQIWNDPQMQAYPNVFVIEGIHPPDVLRAYVELMDDRSPTKPNTTLEIIFNRKS